MFPAAAFDALVAFADTSSEAAEADTVSGSPCPDPFVGCIFVAECMATSLAEPDHFRTVAWAAREGRSGEDGCGGCGVGRGRGRVDGVIRDGSGEAGAAKATVSIRQPRRRRGFDYAILMWF